MSNSLQLSYAAFKAGTLSLDGLLAASRAFVEHIAWLDRPQDAEDTAQEVLVKVWLAITKFEGRCSYRNWLRAIAGNLIRDKIRHERSMLSGHTVVEMPETEPLHDDSYDVQFHRADDLDDGFSLTSQQHALIASLADGNDLRKIALKTGVTLKAVQGRFSRIREKVRGNSN